MFDIFYTGTKPNLFVFEQQAANLDEAAVLSRTEYFWFVNGATDFTGFDFNWQCVPWESTHVHVFPSQHQRNGGVYFAHKDHAKNHNWNFRTEQTVTRLVDKDAWAIPSNIDDADFDYSWHPDATEPDYNYHFGTQWQTAGGPVYKGTAGDKRVSSQRVRKLVNMGNWQVPVGIDDSEFDYSWHPDPAEPDYEYHFPTQHQREGGPIYKGTAGIKYASNQKIRMGATQIFYMDFLNPESNEQFKELQEKYPDIKRTRYVSDHLNVLKRIMSMSTTEFVWVISSICNYKQFDFTWHPEAAQREMIHCFSSFYDDERGDTFYIHVESFKRQMIDLELLDWFNVINYITDEGLHRFSSPIVDYHGDDLIKAIKDYEFKTPYAIFTSDQSLNNHHQHVHNCMWTEKDRIVTDLSENKGTCAVPRDIKNYLKTQVYDYPYLIKRDDHSNVYCDYSLDIVFIDNGEPDADRWYNHLVHVLSQETPNFPQLRFDNTVHRVSGVNGRTAAYQAAAKVSQTNWFFAVFAKLEVNKDFDWNWQPDYWQGPKHYIFNSKNPVNGLMYGHQGMIAYNKRLVLENNEPGIDFTLSQPHEAVPILSGVAHFNQDAWMTWRTAFREVLKLKHFSTTQPSVETDYRLKIWTSRAEGEYADWCLRGAQDAIEYFDSVAGAYDKLMLSFEWAWLRAYFEAKY